MIEIRIRDLIALIAITLFTGTSFICFKQQEEIKALNQAIEQKDSLIREIMYKPYK